MRISDWSSDVCSSDLQIGVLCCGRQFRTQPRDRLGPGLRAFPLQDMRYGQCAAMIALDLRCPVERPVASCRKVARQQSFESRSHGLSLTLYARPCPGSFEGGSCWYHTVFYPIGSVSCWERVCLYV